MPQILLIDDDDVTRTILRRMLEQDGHNVVEASDGAAGTRAYRERPADLIH